MIVFQIALYCLIFTGMVRYAVRGGALFFRLNSDNAVIADSNPELINMYRVIAENSDLVIDALSFV